MTAIDDWDERYDAWVHNSADKWGIMEPARPSFLRRGLPDAYRLPVVETLTCLVNKKNRWQGGKIELLSLNGKWSFSLDIRGDTWGNSYGCWVQFCPPYPSRALALQAAIEEIKKRVEEHHKYDRLTGRKSLSGAHLLKWVKSLRQPVQMEMFG